MTTGIQASELGNLDRTWHLRQAHLMQGLDDQDVTAVEEICKDRICSKGQVIFQQGSPASHLFILFRGSVRSSVGNDGGKERIVGFFKTGDVLGENILGSEPVYRSEAVAHEECWIGAISRSDFGSLMRQRPRLALNFIQILSSKLEQAREEIKALSFLGTQERLAKTLLDLGVNHGKTIVSESSFRKLHFPLSHEHLARLVSANRPHVSTIMSEFRKKGWIHYQGRKLLINMKEMAEAAKPLEMGRLAS